MSSVYLDDLFLENINKDEIKTVFELGSRDLVDSSKIVEYYGCDIYSFECNPDCIKECRKNLNNFSDETKSKIHLIEKAVSLKNENVTFYPFDLEKFNNMGASSMFKIDFGMRNQDGIRLDSFIQENKIDKIDMLCIDLQGYELNAIKSMEHYLNNVKYIITECSIENTYIGGATFIELYEYLKSYGFKYVCSNKYNYNFPELNKKGYSEFDALFIRSNNDDDFIYLLKNKTSEELILIAESGVDSKIEKKIYENIYELNENDDSYFYSCYKLGCISNDIDEKIKYFLNGIKVNTKRLECYYKLMMYYYDKNDYRKAAGWGLMAPTCRNVDPGYLLPDIPIYNALFDINLSVACYYSGYYEEGYKACKRTIESTADNSQYYKLAHENLKFFDSKINFSINEPPRQELIVIENFYPDPESVRNNAINMVFDVKGNYPGQRTKPFFHLGIKEKFESIIGRPIVYWPTDNYNGSFQWVTENDKSWIHRDQTLWSAIIFLTPNPPKDGGTIIYVHKPTNKSYAGTDEIEKQMGNSTYTPEDWEILDRIGNNFNRCILFRGKRCHMSDRYFGTDLTNARLFQTFFFND